MFGNLTSTLTGTTDQQIRSINKRLWLIVVIFSVCCLTGIGIKVFFDTTLADFIGVVLGLASLLPLSLAPSYICIRRSLVRDRIDVNVRRD